MDPRRYLMKTYVDSGLVDVNEVVNGVHVLSPRFVADQVERSRRNLGLETIDLYLLEDPELTLAAHGPSVFRTLLAQTLRDARGRSARAARSPPTGSSTWHGLLRARTASAGTSRSWSCSRPRSRSAAPDHHLRGIALPYNVALGEAKGARVAVRSGGERRRRCSTRCATPAPPCSPPQPLVHGRAARGLPLFFRQAFPDQRDRRTTVSPVRAQHAGRDDGAGARMRSPEHVDENLAHAPSASRPSPRSIAARCFERARKRSRRGVIASAPWTSSTRPAEEAFRTKVRTWLEKNAPRAEGRALARGRQGLAAQAPRGRLPRRGVAEGVRRRGPLRHGAGDPQRGAHAREGARRARPDGHLVGRPGDHEVRHRGAEAALRRAHPRRATTSGRPATPSPAPAATCSTRRRARCATATTTW